MLNYEFPPLGGGAGNAAYYLLKEFKKVDVKIDLVTSSLGSFKIRRFAKNINIHYLDIGKKGNLHYQTNKDLLMYSFKAYGYSKKLMKTNEYDFCHAFFGVPCGYIAMKLGLPYVVSLRGSDVPFYNKRFYWFDKFVFKRLSKKVWINAKKVIALSYNSVALAKRTFKKKKIDVIYNGVDTKEFKPDKQVLSREKTFNILFVGRLIERKGLMYLLDAFNELVKKYPYARLEVAGGGPLFGEYEGFVKNNRLKGKVRLYGVLPHTKTHKLYKKSHVFVLPSLNEALGNVTHEAIASGLPVITTNTGAAELVRENGYIIKKANSKEIYDSLEKLIKNKKIREKMSRKSRLMAQKMGWDSCAEKYMDVYRNFK